VVERAYTIDPLLMSGSAPVAPPVDLNLPPTRGAWQWADEVNPGPPD